MSGHTATWTLHRQPKDQIADHEFSIWRDDNPVVMANIMPGEGDTLATIVRAMDSHVDLVKALERCKRLIKEALPKFNWGASALDANAIKLLNEVPGEVRKALAKVRT